MLNVAVEQKVTAALLSAQSEPTARIQIMPNWPPLSRPHTVPDSSRFSAQSAPTLGPPTGLHPLSLHFFTILTSPRTFVDTAAPPASLTSGVRALFTVGLCPTIAYSVKFIAPSKYPREWAVWVPYTDQSQPSSSHNLIRPQLYDVRRL